MINTICTTLLSVAIIAFFYWLYAIYPAKQRRTDIARALAAFPGHWTSAHLMEKRCWPDIPILPDVVVSCGWHSIDLFKAARVRSFEASDDDLKMARTRAAQRIRQKRREGQQMKMAAAREVARLMHLAKISVSIRDLPRLRG
jgi:hypothetical protein